MSLPVVIIVAAVVVFFVIESRREKQQESARVDNIIKNYGKACNRKYTADELKAVKAYSEYKNHDLIDDITWNDLDMWLIYKKMNYCHSSAGDEYLYSLLKEPFIEETKWDAFEEKVTKISEDEELRRKLVLALSSMGRTGKYSIYKYLDCLDNLNLWSNTSDIISDLLYIPAIAACFFAPLWGVATIIILVVFNIATYFKKKRSIEAYIVCFEYIFRVLKNSDILDGINSEVLKEELTDLVEIRKGFQNFRRFSSIAIGDLGSSPVGVLLDYVRMITHLDLIKIRSMVVQVKEHKEDIIKILNIIGRIDTYMSVGEFRKSLGNYCVPKLDKSIKCLNISDGFHPLISNPVSNSIELENSILITGSNASGKSTFLKMVAVNAILAQAVHTCAASNYEAPYYRIYSSLSLKDNIVEGDSYYMAEIKALKRIIDASVNSDVPVIGFVDEILKGTNTIERISASSAIIRNLIQKNVLVCAATHDIELTTIIKECDNYHFEETMSDADIKFSYELMPGRANTRNAIKLLELMGYSEDIIKQAYEGVDSFEEKGIWE